MITGIGPIGCCPSLRYKNKTDECSEETNYWSAKYNEGLKSMLQKLKSEFKDINYSYFDTYSVLLSLIQNPTAYGTQLFFFLLRNEAKIMSLTKKTYHSGKIVRFLKFVPEILIFGITYFYLCSFPC